jgi:cell division protein FtsB
VPPDVIDAIAPLIALFGLGTIVLVGLKLRYDHLRRTRLDQGSREEIARLAEDVAALRDDMQLLRRDVGEMYERIEFTERLLIRGKADEGTPPG